MLCKYKNIFGHLKKGVHSIRLFDIAVLDVLGTILIAWLIAYFFKWNVIIVLVIAFLSGIILHRLFCVNTTLNKLIFGKI